jgi:GT2 family glycosyltransferase
MVPTHNRVRELRRTLAMVHGLSAAPMEVLVTADGCNDGTEEMIKREFPETRLRVNTEAVGSVAARDWMMRHANGDLVLALDDDSYPEQNDCIARFVPLFEKNPHLAVVHFPQRTDEYPDTLTQCDLGQPRLSGSFANSGAVIRRAHYLALEGFEPRFFHMYEEPDFALQCVAAGYEVLFTPAVTIRHHYSPEARSELRNHEFWSTLRRCPLPYVFGVLAWRVVSQFRYACTRGPVWAMQEPVWWAQALCGIAHCLRNRRAVPWGSYKRWLELGMEQGRRGRHPYRNLAR